MEETVRSQMRIGWRWNRWTWTWVEMEGMEIEGRDGTDSYLDIERRKKMTKLWKLEQLFVYREDKDMAKLWKLKQIFG